MAAEGARWTNSAEDHWEMEMSVGHMGSTENRGQNSIKPQGKLSS